MSKSMAETRLVVGRTAKIGRDVCDRGKVKQLFFCSKAFKGQEALFAHNGHRQAALGRMQCACTVRPVGGLAVQSRPPWLAASSLAYQSAETPVLRADARES